MTNDRAQCFHVISRIVDKRFIFDDEEKEYLLTLVRKHEGFSGIEILSYCLMGNHFHLLVHVPARPEEISEKEVRNRMKCIYSKQKMSEIDELIIEQTSNGSEIFKQELYDRMRNRMYDLSSFVRDIKQKFSSWYNKKMERKGTLWEERFKSILVEGEGGALMRVAAYIELNPIRARIAENPKEYRWCSYTEGLAGGKRARTGICKLAGGITGIVSWVNAIETYRSYIFYKSESQLHRRKGINAQESESEKNTLTREMWSTRIRYFSDGVILGSKRFVQSFSRDRSETKDTKRANRINSSGEEMYAYRRLKEE